MNGFRQHREVVLGIGSFLTGIFGAADFLGRGFLLGIFLLLWGFWKLKPPLSFLIILILAFGLGFLRYSFELSRLEGVPDFPFNPVTFEAVVIDFPDVRSDRVRLTLQLDAATLPTVLMDLPGEMVITVSRYPDYFYGDRLRVTGIVQPPAVFDDFSYKDYLRRYGIHSVMYYPKVELLAHDTLNSWKAIVFGWKSSLETQLNFLFTEPHASFAAGLLLGSRRGIPSALMEDFNRSGLTHVIAISGYNITLIILFVSWIFSFLPQRSKIIVSTVFIFIFVVLVGASAAVVRAAILGVLSLWAILFGRQAAATRLLTLTAALMSFWNPFILVDDVGFQLSFAATCGLMYATPYVKRGLEILKLYSKIPEAFSIREAFVTTLSAQTFAVPIILFNFGRLSLIAPLANVAVVSLIPLAMLSSFLALCVSFFSYSGGLLLAYVAWFFLECIMRLTHLFSQLPFASFEW